MFFVKSKLNDIIWQYLIFLIKSKTMPVQSILLILVIVVDGLESIRTIILVELEILFVAGIALLRA